MNNFENLKVEDILKFIKEVNYGEVIFIIHNSQIVQIEKREKKRFNTQKRLQEQS